MSRGRVCPACPAVGLSCALHVLEVCPMCPACPGEGLSYVSCMTRGRFVLHVQQ